MKECSGVLGLSHVGAHAAYVADANAAIVVLGDVGALVLDGAAFFYEVFWDLVGAGLYLYHVVVADVTPAVAVLVPFADFVHGVVTASGGGCAVDDDVLYFLGVERMHVTRVVRKIRMMIILYVVGICSRCCSWVWVVWVAWADWVLVAVVVVMVTAAMGVVSSCMDRMGRKFFRICAGCGVSKVRVIAWAVRLSFLVVVVVAAVVVSFCRRCLLVLQEVRSDIRRTAIKWPNKGRSGFLFIVGAGGLC